MNLIVEVRNDCHIGVRHREGEAAAFRSRQFLLDGGRRSGRGIGDGNLRQCTVVCRVGIQRESYFTSDDRCRRICGCRSRLCALFQIDHSRVRIGFAAGARRKVHITPVLDEVRVDGDLSAFLEADEFGDLHIVVALGIMRQGDGRPCFVSLNIGNRRSGDSCSGGRSGGWRLDFVAEVRLDRECEDLASGFTA